jgi:hypothetical protein
MKGPIENGMVDTMQGVFPVFKKIMATSKKIPSQKLYNLFKEKIPEAVKYCLDNNLCYLDDEYFMELGFSPDIDACGKIKIRDATISQENQQRCKCMTGLSEQEKREKYRAEIDDELQRKEQLKELKKEQIISADWSVVKQLCDIACVEASEANVGLCTWDHFNELSAPQLKLFITSRHPQWKKSNDIKHLKRPRGKKSKDDHENGVVNLISVAFELRHEKSRLLALNNMDVNDSNDVIAENILREPMIVTVSPFKSTDNETKPSEILSNPEKVALMLRVFDPNGKINIISFTTPMSDTDLERLGKADSLYLRLQSRLRAHMKTKVKLCQRQSKCLSWASKNLALVSAWMILTGHVKDDISCLDDSKCLLALPYGNKFLPCYNDELLCPGCYLYYDTINDVWIRSGSATAAGDGTGKGGGIGKRLKQHLARAKADINEDESRFYALYPSKMSSRSNSTLKRGTFESLQAYVGVCFTYENIPGCFSGKHGLLEHTAEEEEWISNINFLGKSGEQKYMQMAAYLFELGYDLALAKIDNVSESPGFEGCGLRKID